MPILFVMMFCIADVGVIVVEKKVMETKLLKNNGGYEGTPATC
jgi:hypothetical protein